MAIRTKAKGAASRNSNNKGVMVYLAPPRFDELAEEAWSRRMHLADLIRELISQALEARKK